MESGWECPATKEKNIAVERNLYQRNLGPKFENLPEKAFELQLASRQKPGGELGFDRSRHVPGTNRLSSPDQPGYKNGSETWVKVSEPICIRFRHLHP